MKGLDLDGDEVEIEADELMGRLFQHELDHLNGVLMFDRMQPISARRARRVPPDRRRAEPRPKPRRLRLK